MQSLVKADDSTGQGIDYESYRSRNPSRVPGTCTWFLQHTKYLNWRDELSSSLLWLSADPGCGKSVLALFLVEELQTAASQQALKGNVCHFFFKDDNKQQSSAVYALRAVLHQLLSKRTRLPKYVITEYENKGEALFGQFGSLWNVFKAVATKSGESNTICILDGLDECELNLNHLLIAMVEFYEPVKTGKDMSTDAPSLKIIVTSRPENAIKTHFRKLPTIRLRGEDETEATEHDIGLVVAHSLGEMVEQMLLNQRSKDLLTEKLIANADQTFLWVALILSLVKDATEYGASENELSALLDDRSIDSLYGRFLSKSVRNPEAEKKARLLLQIIIAAHRPLTLIEMDIVISLRPEHQCHEDLQPNLHSSPESYLKQLCGHFIRCKDQKVYLVHQTARDFLIREHKKLGFGAPECGSWGNWILPEVSHALLANICIQYLFLREFQYGVEDFVAKRSLGQSDIQIREEYCSVYPFMQYAATFWHYHARIGQTELNEAIISDLRTLGNTRSTRFWTWFYIYALRWSPAITTERTVLHYRALGSFSTFEDLKSDTPLEWARKGGHSAIMTLLSQLNPKLQALIKIRPPGAPEQVTFPRSEVDEASQHNSPTLLTERPMEQQSQQLGQYIQDNTLMGSQSIPYEDRFQTFPIDFQMPASQADLEAILQMDAPFDPLPQTIDAQAMLWGMDNSMTNWQDFQNAVTFGSNDGLPGMSMESSSTPYSLYPPKYDTYLDPMNHGNFFISEYRQQSGKNICPAAAVASVPITISKPAVRRNSNRNDAKKVGRRRGPLLPEQRKQASEIRNLRACLRCKFLRKTCDKGEPCAGCQPSHARLWQVPCTRIDIKEMGYFLRGWKADYEPQFHHGIAVYNIKGFAQKEEVLWITHGYGFAFPVMAREVYVADDSVFNLHWVEAGPGEPLEFDVRTEGISAGAEGVSTTALSEYLDKHLDRPFEDFIDNHFEGTPFITEILKTAHRYYLKENNLFIRKALKLVLAYNLTQHLTMVEQTDKKNEMKGLIDDEKSKFHRKIAAPVMINFQTKSALGNMWRELHKDILEELSSLYTGVYSGERWKKWPSIFLLTSILLVLWEEMQFDCHYRVPDPAAVNVFCNDMEKIPVAVIVGLFHAISLKLPTFAEWETCRHGHILNNSVAGCDVMTEMNAHVKKHGEHASYFTSKQMLTGASESYLRTRADVSFDSRNFDCLSNKFLHKLVIWAN